jgi:hypothetical protein
MKHLFLLLGFTFCLSLSFGQESPKSVTGKKFDKKGAGANLVVPNTDVVAPKPDKTRSQCCISFDNYTGLWLDVWVDGVYKGHIAPWEEGDVCVYSGWTTYYIRSSGGTYEWSDSGDCNGWFSLKID